jgi:hypothetical protein
MKIVIDSRPTLGSYIVSTPSGTSHEALASSHTFYAHQRLSLQHPLRLTSLQDGIEELLSTEEVAFSE